MQSALGLSSVGPPAAHLCFYVALPMFSTSDSQGVTGILSVTIANFSVHIQGISSHVNLGAEA